MPDCQILVRFNSSDNSLLLYQYSKLNEFLCLCSKICKIQFNEKHANEKRRTYVYDRMTPFRAEWTNLFQEVKRMEDTLEVAAMISVDVETTGPAPGLYSLLSIGACTLTRPRQTFYVEIQPLNDRFVPEAMAVNRLDLADLRASGLPPQEAMGSFASWLREILLPSVPPIFVAFNAGFDWMFVNDYFHRYLGQNPFGHSALDIKSFYMGKKGVAWRQTAMDYLSRRYLENRTLSHHALQDALDQAELFEAMLADRAA